MKVGLVKLFALLILMSSVAQAEFKVPPLLNPVNDYANVLTAPAKEVISYAVVAMKEQTGAQLGVLIVDTLDGTTIEEASMKVAEAWNLGKKVQNKGVLLMLAIKDRKSRIEVGYGLEPILTDAKSKEILASMRSDLRAGNFDNAVNHGVSQIYSLIKDSNEVIPVEPDSDGHGVLIFWLVFGSAVIGIVFYVRRVGKREEEERKERDRAFKETMDRFRNDNEQRYTEYNRNYPSKNRETTKKSSETSYVPIVTHDDSYSRSSSYDSDSSSSSSSSGTDWGGGGGDFGGGGSSDSW